MTNFFTYITNNEKSADANAVNGTFQWGEKAEKKDKKFITIPMTSNQTQNTEKNAPENTVAFPFLQEKNENTTTKTQSANSVFTTSATNDDYTKITTISPENKTKAKTMSNYFSHYYARYANADQAGKEKFIERYLKSFKTEEKQAKEFERLRKSGVSEQEIDLLADSIDALKTKNQLNAEISICTKGTEAQNRAGRRGVARNIQRFDETIHDAATKFLIETKDIEAIKIGSTHASECSNAKQEKIVKMYKEIENAEVNKNLIDQYGAFAKENQVAIHKVMSSSKLSETVEYAAANIYHFAAENQKAAIQITIETNNEAAINAAAEKINYYDKSVQAEAKTILSNTQYESVKTTMENAPQPSNTTSSAAQATVTKETFKEANLTEKIKMMSSMSKADKEVYMKEMIKSSSNAEKLALISSLPPSALFSVINVILDSNPSMEILSKITTLMGQVKEKDQTTLMQKLHNSYSASLLNTQASLFDSNMQKLFVTKMADKGELNQISIGNLGTDAKDLYNQFLKKQG